MPKYASRELLVESMPVLVLHIALFSELIKRRIKSSLPDHAPVDLPFRFAVTNWMKTISFQYGSREYIPERTRTITEPDTKGTTSFMDVNCIALYRSNVRIDSYNMRR